MTVQEILNAEARLRDRVSQLMMKLADTRVVPYILYGAQANITAGPNVITSMPETSFRLPGIGPFVLRGVEWFSNTARNTTPGTINWNERRKVRTLIQTVSDHEPWSRFYVLSAVMFRYDTARWDCPHPMVTDGLGSFKVDLMDDGITAAQDVFISFHGDIYVGIDRVDLEECSNLGLLEARPPAAVLSLFAESGRQMGPNEIAFRERRLQAVESLRHARIFPYVLTDTLANLAANSITSMTVENFRIPTDLGPFVWKNFRYYSCAATRAEIVGDDGAGTTYTINNDMLDRTNLFIYDLSRSERRFTINRTMPGLVVRWDTCDWALEHPYVLNSAGMFQVEIQEALGQATTDVFVAFHGYITQRMSFEDTLAAVGLGLLT